MAYEHSPYFSLANLLNNMTQTSIEQGNAEARNKLLTEFEMPMKTFQMQKEMKDYIRTQTPVDMDEAIRGMFPQASKAESDYVKGRMLASGFARLDENGKPTSTIRYGDLAAAYKTFTQDPTEVKGRFFAARDELAARRGELEKAKTGITDQAQLGEIDKQIAALDATGKKMSDEFVATLGDKAFVSTEKAKQNLLTGEKFAGEDINNDVKLALAATGNDPAKANALLFKQKMAIVNAAHRGSGTGTSKEKPDSAGAMNAISQYLADRGVGEIGMNVEPGKKATLSEVMSDASKRGVYDPNWGVPYTTVVEIKKGVANKLYHDLKRLPTEDELMNATGTYMETKFGKPRRDLISEYHNNVLNNNNVIGAASRLKNWRDTAESSGFNPTGLETIAKQQKKVVPTKIRKQFGDL